MLKVNGFEIPRGSFPDGTLHMKFDSMYRTIGAYNEIEWFYEDDAELFALICLKRHLDEVEPLKTCLYLPYIPHARMDRVKSIEDVFTLKYFCEVINSLNFFEVVVVDAHSNVSLALLNNVINIQPEAQLKKLADKLGNPLMFYPDEGAMKRYSELISAPYTFGMKDREWETGKIRGLILMNKELVKDKDVLIVDDICSRGGTFYHSAKALKEAGAKNIYLFVSHLEHTVFEGEMISSGLIDKIYTLKTIFCEDWANEKIEVIK